MHNPCLAVDDETLNKNFDAVFDLLHDHNLNKHVGRYIDTNSFIKGVEKVRVEHVK